MSKLFGTDGVRGKAGKELNVDLVLKLAMSAGIYFRNSSSTNKILIGKDTRRSGYMVENAIVAGLTAVGYDCVQVGPLPTPAIAFLTEDMRCDAGIMISASHNPYFDNGIKFFDGDGGKLNEDVEAQIEKIFKNPDALDENFKTLKEIGSSKRIDDVIGRYIVHIKNSFPKDLSLRGLRIVVDCANGAAYKVAPAILSELGADIIVIADEPNGFNINEKCGALHPEAMAKEVLKYRADIGIALDGDADRVVIVDEKGEVIDGDKLIASLALYLKESNQLKGSGIAATVMSNGAMEEFLNKHGINLLRCNVGDKYVIETMKANGLNFGGEQSGHIVFSDYAKTGDGLASALLALAYTIRSKKKASEALNPFQSYPQMQEALPVKVKKPLENIEGLDALLKDIEKQKIRHLIRYSGTENKLRILLEGKDAVKLAKEFEKVSEFLQKALNA
jgi:phosphoglucosamine mutase